MKQTLASARENYLSIERTTALKGLLAIAVLLSHMVPASDLVRGSILSPLIGSLGYLSVAAFFFLSGYGIVAQYEHRKEQYLKGFLSQRVLSIYLLMVFLVLVYGAFRILMKIPFSASEVVQSLLVGNTIVSNGWYLQIILLFYLFWYFSTRHVHKQSLQFPVLCVLVLCYMLFGMLNLAHFWFQSSLGFLLGVYWKQNKQKVDDWLFDSWKRIWWMLVIVFVIFCATFLLTAKGVVGSAAFIRPFRTVMSCMAAALFVIVMLLLNIVCGKMINCGVLRVLGTYSMEIYVLQGLPLHVFKVGPQSLASGWPYIACVSVGTVLLAFVLRPVIRFITNIPKKYLRGN